MVLHPEDPSRVTTIMERLQVHGIIDRCDKLLVRPATIEELETCHTSDHLDKMAAYSAAARGTKEVPGPGVVYAKQKNKDTYFNEFTANCARLAAGACVQVAVEVAR